MLKILSTVSFITCFGVVSLLILLGIFLPDLYSEVVPFRFYNVLTNSMEPTIKTHSLVLVKTYDGNTQIEKGDIITFFANRFGERIIITHRFSHTETNDEGEIVYKTHPEGTDTLDVYETKREDLLGIYLFQIPYAGKFILFIKSAFGFVWLCQIAVILLIKKLIAARWEEKQMCMNGLFTIAK